MWQEVAGNQIIKINRAWKSGDVVELELPMHIFKNTWYENSQSVERGPIVYALKMGEEVKRVENTKDAAQYGNHYFEVLPTTPWNYGLIHVPDNKLAESYTVEKKGTVADYPWNLNNVPILIKAKAKRIPGWQLYNEMAGPIPYSIAYNLKTEDAIEEITLVPYGCTQLRISQFPVIAAR